MTITVVDPRSYMTYQPLGRRGSGRQPRQAGLRASGSESPRSGLPGDEEAKEMIAMFSTDEQQELCKIEDRLRAQDRGFVRRLRLQQGVLRWAAPGRQGFLLALAMAAVAAVALLAVGTVIIRRVLTAARAALTPDVPALMAIGAKARPGWDVAQPPRHGAYPG